MKQIPILFSTPMVQAILEGGKSQTRRLVKDKHVLYSLDVNRVIPEYFKDGDGGWCPYGQPGEVLWVRETWVKACLSEDGAGPVEGAGWKYWYKADNEWTKHDWHDPNTDGPVSSPKWKPSIYMPKEAARIWLQVTDVRVERLQNISEEDAIKEGIKRCQKIKSAGYGYFDYSGTPTPESYNWGSPVDSFRTLWQSINGADSWQANPWVWVISFKVLSTTGKPTTI